MSGNVFQWKAASNGLSPVNHEIFSLSVSDPCNPAVHFQLHVDVLPCPCLNGGSCVVEGEQDRRQQPDWIKSNNQIQQSYRCQCPAGFAGPDCGQRTMMDSPCQPDNPCRNGGQCSAVAGPSEPGTTYSCQCIQGYQGIHCEQSSGNVTALRNVTDCTMPCLNGGSCLVKKDRCSCPAGFAGRQCQWVSPECRLPCLNGGHCNRRGHCYCQKGWTGPQCQTGIQISNQLQSRFNPFNLIQRFANRLVSTEVFVRRRKSAPVHRNTAEHIAKRVTKIKKTFKNI